VCKHKKPCNGVIKHAMLLAWAYSPTWKGRSQIRCHAIHREDQGDELASRLDEPRPGFCNSRPSVGLHCTKEPASEIGVMSCSMLRSKRKCRLATSLVFIVSTQFQGPEDIRLLYATAYAAHERAYTIDKRTWSRGGGSSYGC